MALAEQDLFFERLSEKHLEIIKSFRCYEEELADFLLEDAYSNQINRISVTYLFFLKENKHLAGYISVLNDSINLNAELKQFFRGKDIHYKSLPALKVGRIAVSEEHAGKGVGTHMMNFAIYLAYKTYDNCSGCRFITLDAKRAKNPERDSIHFYRKLGFRVLKEREKGPVPMYFDPMLNKK